MRDSNSRVLYKARAITDTDMGYGKCLLNLPKEAILEIGRQKNLAEIRIGETCVILNVECSGAMLRRLLDLGITPGTRVTLLFTGPAKNPIALSVRGTVIALRREDCAKIAVHI